MKTAFARQCVLAVVLWLFALVWAANGQNGVPRPEHVVIVIEENKSFGRIIGSAEAPYINSLAERGALFTSSFAIRHPSQPNYLALFSGSTHGVGDDSCPHTFTTANLGSRLFDAGLTFIGYSESMPRPGYKGCETGNYARKHNPWVNFTNVPASANLPFTSFPATFTELPTVSIVVPNLNSDMHDGPIPLGDAWLRDHFQRYIQWAMSNNSLFVLTWDEGHNGSDNRIVTLLVGPMVRPGEYCERINHYNMLRTLLEMYGLAPIDKAATVDPITSAWTPESVSSPVTIALTSPTAGAVLAEPAVITLTAEATSANSEITKVEFYQRGTQLGAATNRPFTFTWSNVAAGAYCFVAKATDALGHRRTSLSIPVEVHVSDQTPPGVSITSPASDVRVTNSLLVLQGAATDNVAVARVQYQVGDGQVQVADGTTNWSAPVELPPGPSVIRVQSVDTSSNLSSVFTRTVTYTVLSPLTIQIAGPGKVVPDLSGQELEVGRLYQFKPVPEVGYVFAKPGAGSREPIRFMMQSNLVLQVNFVRNPFPAVMGTYQGLLYDTNRVTPESSGFFALALDAKGASSGRVQLGERTFRVTQDFDAFGHASTPLGGRGDLTPGLVLTADWQLDLTNGTDQIRGVVQRASSGGGGSQSPFAEILGDRDVFKGTTNRAMQAGRYTIIFPHNTSGVAGPDGDGIGAVLVDTAGRVRLTGALADGTRVTRTASLSKAGQWPLYIPLNGGSGTFLGWIGFTSQATNALNGLVSWIAPSRPATKYYPDGFTNESMAIGSTYRAPSGPTERILNITNGLVTFEGGGLSAPFTNRFQLDANNKVSKQGNNRLTLSFAKQTGLWNGTVADPEPIRFRGVVHQGLNAGRGFFLSTNLSGRVQLGPE